VISGIARGDITRDYVTAVPRRAGILINTVTNVMRYAEYPAPPPLAGIVDRFWILEGRAPGVPEPIIPDGRVEIVLHFGQPFDRHHADGRVERQAPGLVVGQMRAPVCICPSGSAGVAGIRLAPAAARTVLGCPAGEITGQFVEIEALLGSTSLLRERLGAAASDAVRVRLLEQWIGARVSSPPTRDVEAAVRAITATGGSTDLVSIAAHAGISLRQLERRFLADVGLTPKVFARLVRLQSALRRISDGEPLADAAVACGYYDQAHMARDFGHLAETSPTAWRRYAGVLTPLFVSR
jgi:AraC-like DNA-binding protein